MRQNPQLLSDVSVIAIQAGRSLSTSSLVFENNYALNPDVEGMPTEDLTVSFWARTPAYNVSEIGLVQDKKFEDMFNYATHSPSNEGLSPFLASLAMSQSALWGRMSVLDLHCSQGKGSLPSKGGDAQEMHRLCSALLTSTWRGKMKERQETLQANLHDFLLPHSGSNWADREQPTLTKYFEEGVNADAWPQSTREL